MALISYIFSMLVACLSYAVYQKYVHTYTSIVVKAEKRYDYIIVGAGTAGCVLAARLSEDLKTRVLLVEAGEHMGYFTRIPLTATAAQQGPNDWAVRTTPQKYSSFGMWGQSQFIPRGKGLGGSGQINFLLHGVGHPEDYERWARLGFHGWSFEDLKPYFVKAFGTVRSEFNSEDCAVDGECPGDKAPLKLKLIREQDQLLDAFRQASALLKDKHTTLRQATATIKDGRRHSTLDGYLKPAFGRKNLHVLLRTQAVSIRFENRTASSLYILQNHRELDNIFVNKEIILCAGAIKTPQIMTLSGIGPEDVLRRLRIKAVSVSPGVGRNLHDHMNMPLYVSVARAVTLTLGKVFSFGTVLEYLWKGTGALSSPAARGVEVRGVEVRGAEVRGAEVRGAEVRGAEVRGAEVRGAAARGAESRRAAAVLLVGSGAASERLLRDLSNYKPKVFRATFPFHNQTGAEGFLFLCSCLQPASRGRVSARASRGSAPPAVDPAYLQRHVDVRCIIRAIRRAEKLVSSKPFQDLGAKIHWPRAERCLTFWNYTVEDQTGVRKKRTRQNQTPKAAKQKILKSPPDEYLECIIREVAVTGHHVGGTCAGGTVVDDQLRVKSVSGLRIMDASVLPSPVSLFPNSVLVAMAERAADIILNGTRAQN